MQELQQILPVRVTTHLDLAIQEFPPAVNKVANTEHKN
jgi:hypothetical protein